MKPFGRFSSLERFSKTFPRPRLSVLFRKCNVMWRHLHSAALTLQPVKWVRQMISFCTKVESHGKNYLFLPESIKCSHVIEYVFSSKLSFSCMNASWMLHACLWMVLTMFTVAGWSTKGQKNASFISFLSNESNLSKRLIPSAVIFHAY